MFEFAVSPQVVAAGISSSTQWALEPAREVHMIVVANVRHYFATQFASMQVAATWQLVKR